MRRKIILVIVLLIFLASMFLSFFNVELAKLDKKNTKIEISRLKEKIKDSKDSINNSNQEINDLKESNKDKLEEVEIWEKAVKKLEDDLY